jgi:hypothetical protein
MSRGLGDVYKRQFNDSGKVPCITATYHIGYDGFGTRPYILENGK